MCLHLKHIHALGQINQIYFKIIGPVSGTEVQQPALHIIHTNPNLVRQTGRQQVIQAALRRIGVQPDSL